MRYRPGNSIVEVLLAISIASIVVASVGNLIVSVNRVDRTSAHLDQALAYAREALEITPSIATAEFSNTTNCGTPGYGQKPPGYASCWSACPQGVCAVSYYLVQIGTPLTWHLIPGNAKFGTNPEYTREITVGDVSGSTDQNVRQVTAIVKWQERGQPKNVTLATVLTAWKDAP